jgi:hypothetical protein
MTERERIREDGTQHMETLDEVLVATRPIREPVPPLIAPQSSTRTWVVLPVDRVRWSAVLAGVFAALATATLLSVVGLALNLAAGGPGSLASALGIGAGLWGAITAFVALMVGGWAAARTAALPGRANGALNGMMVWMVMIPLVLYLLGSGAILAAVADGAVATGAQVSAPLTGQDTNAPAPQALTGQTAGSNAAWGTLLALLLGFVAATLGGLLGARRSTDLAATYVVLPDHTGLP